MNGTATSASIMSSPSASSSNVSVSASTERRRNGAFGPPAPAAALPLPPPTAGFRWGDKAAPQPLRAMWLHSDTVRWTALAGAEEGKDEEEVGDGEGRYLAPQRTMPTGGARPPRDPLNARRAASTRSRFAIAPMPSPLHGSIHTIGRCRRRPRRRRWRRLLLLLLLRWVSLTLLPPPACSAVVVVLLAATVTRIDNPTRMTDPTCAKGTVRVRSHPALQHC